MSLLALEGVTKRFAAGRSLLGAPRVVHAVNGISFEIQSGETFALVGESGCGKSTAARIALGLDPPSSGEVRYRGDAIDTLAGARRKAYRRGVQVIFQDSNASLNPRRTIGQILATALQVTRPGEFGSRAAALAAARGLLDDVGLAPAASFLTRYPHELSGGQRQRVGIARALAPDPELIVADEPVSALDISVRAQILSLLERIQRERGVALLFISHDLAVVRAVARRVAVMYLGRFVEVGPVEEVFGRAVHPYTEALLAATPHPHPSDRPERLVIAGDVPSPLAIPSGCAFHTRCPLAEARCRSEEPPLREVGAGHRVACHLAEARLAGLGLTSAAPPSSGPARKEP